MNLKNSILAPGVLQPSLRERRYSGESQSSRTSTTSNMTTNSDVMQESDRIAERALSKEATQHKIVQSFHCPDGTSLIKKLMLQRLVEKNYLLQLFNIS